MSELRGRAPTGGRLMAWLALEMWENAGVSADDALETVCQGADPRERGLAVELTMGVLRWRGRLDHILARLLTQPLNKLHTGVLILLRLGIYQLRSLDRIPVHAAIHETVELCRPFKLEWARGLVNGVLRRYDREREALEAQPTGNALPALAARYSHPRWLLSGLLPLMGNDLHLLLEANNTPPPLCLRVNPLKATPEEALTRLQAEGLEARASSLVPGAILLHGAGAPASLPGFQEGWYAVQDEASQLVSLVTGALPGEKVLDTCAAPGGKTCHLAAMVGESGEVWATDAHMGKLERVREAARRLVPGRVRVLAMDWGPQPPPTSLPRDFHRVLVDAPCSGFGVLRRLPEIKWRRTAEEAATFPARQLAILETAANHVRPGGTLVYSVCTPLLAEGPEVVDAFLARWPAFQRVPLQTVLEPPLHPLVTPAGDVRTLSHRDGCDTFFIARLERSTQAL